jgi:hypothetical protein
VFVDDLEDSKLYGLERLILFLWAIHCWRATMVLLAFWSSFHLYQTYPVSLQLPFALYFGYRKLKLNPGGRGTRADTSLYLYLVLDDLEILSSNRKLYVKYKFRIRNQIDSKHLERTFMFLTFLHKNML